jgi:hypothetical protein
MHRFFNTTGACYPDKHYTLPAAERLVEARRLIDQEGYFVLHAPRQTGKTTSLLDLCRQLTAEGRYAALHVSCEAGEAAGEDYGAAELIVWGHLRQRARDLPEALRPPMLEGDEPPGQRLGLALDAWARVCPRPIVLVLDEIDALVGQSLISVLRQLRAGFPSRPRAFPSSVILCGLRDVRDYKASSGGAPTRLGTSSPFNIKVESLRLGDFTQDEVKTLYTQHTVETGQVFTDESVTAAWGATRGQPWLVNALAREVVEKIGVPPEVPITGAHIEEARERLILARQTHLDSLVDRLHEPRVKRVIEPLLVGEELSAAAVTTEAVAAEAALGPYDDDLQYVRDLGLVAPDSPLRMANTTYREVIVRVLAKEAEAKVIVAPQRAFVGPDGRLDMPKLLNAFAAFWREHGQALARRMPYHEVAPQLVLMAFLQRVVNGGGYVDREYGIGRGRIDLLVRWPLPDAASMKDWQHEVLELKVWREGKADPLAAGLGQLDGYLAEFGLEHGALVVFDRRPGIGPAEERTRFEEARTEGGREVTVLRA